MKESHGTVPVVCHSVKVPEEKDPRYPRFVL
jgi:hypothetical protein